MAPRGITILICTHNRASLLDQTLDAVAELRRPAGVAVQLVVVDNNSTDQTPAVIERHKIGFPFPLVPLREERQGKSFALNRGLGQAAGEILLLTDDDTLPAQDWLVRTAAVFEQYPVNFAFGKVLPRWEHDPPSELLTVAAQEIWGPLALVDYGDEPVDYLPREFGEHRLPIGANLAFRRDVLVRIGGWRNDLGKVNNSLIAGEDHEIFHRLYRAGLFYGRYDPAIAVRHHVPSARLRPRYFRRWFFWNGRTIGRMLPDYYQELDFSRVPRLAGAPRFLYRQAAAQAMRWLRAPRAGAPPKRWIEQLYAIRYLGVLVECWTRRGADQEAAAGGLTAPLPGHTPGRREGELT